MSVHRGLHWGSVMVRTDPGWIRPLNDVARPAARLVCLPHSGGSATSYHGWAAAMPPDVQLLAVRYPGHDDRFREPSVGSIGELSTHIAGELLRLAPGEPAPYALFGHSLGAVVAYATALILSDRGPAPACLFVSGSAAPGVRRSPFTHQAGDEELWASMCALGGVDPAIAQNPELRELMMPALRADIRANERYRPQGRPLSCPVRCYHSPEDPLTRDADMSAWAALTSGPFSRRERPGGHFHLWLDIDELVGDILTALPRRTTLAA